MIDNDVMPITLFDACIQIQVEFEELLSFVSSTLPNYPRADLLRMSTAIFLRRVKQAEDVQREKLRKYKGGKS